MDHQSAVELVLLDEVARLQEGQSAEPAPEPSPADLPTHTFEMSHEVSASITNRNEPEETTLELPWDGLLKSVILSWQDGSGNGTGVRLRTRSGIALIPRNEEGGFLAGNDFSKEFQIGVELARGEILVAQFINFDTLYPHHIGVTPVIEQRGSAA